ncbi:MAG: flagellar basal body P-ring protein FlgI [Bdellovibrionota bacterium]|nr:MAG: flagellar basal body P-ring protein FlgI [Pseudomonadota bacterium]
MKHILFLALALFTIHAPAAMSQNVRIKELAKLRGDRTNNLIGFGLVIGLNKTGDSPQSFAKNKAVTTLLSRLGIQPDAQPLLTAAAAAVIVTADLPAFARVGDRIDVKVSVIGDAKSLAGGNLLMTPLKGPDGQLYAVADGSIVIGQANGAGAKVQTVAVIPDGGMIEKDFTPALVQNQAIELNLAKADFSTSNRIALAINKHFHNEIATSVDPARVRVRVPENSWSNITGFIAQVESLEVLADQKAVVIINERTGTVVMGGDVKVSDVAITHNGLSISVGTGKQAKPESVMPLEGTTINDLVKSLNQMGVKPEDLISILQSIHASGALRAEIKLM